MASAIIPNIKATYYITNNISIDKNTNNTDNNIIINKLVISCNTFPVVDINPNKITVVMGNFNQTQHIELPVVNQVYCNFTPYAMDIFLDLIKKCRQYKYSSIVIDEAKNTIVIIGKNNIDNEIFGNKSIQDCILAELIILAQKYENIIKEKTHVTINNNLFKIFTDKLNDYIIKKYGKDTKYYIYPKYDGFDIVFEDEKNKKLGNDDIITIFNRMHDEAKHNVYLNLSGVFIEDFKIALNKYFIDTYSDTKIIYEFWQNDEESVQIFLYNLEEKFDRLKFKSDIYNLIKNYKYQEFKIDLHNIPQHKFLKRIKTIYNTCKIDLQLIEGSLYRISIFNVSNAKVEILKRDIEDIIITIRNEETVNIEVNDVDNTTVITIDDSLSKEEINKIKELLKNH